MERRKNLKSSSKQQLDDDANDLDDLTRKPQYEPGDEESNDDDDVDTPLPAINDPDSRPVELDGLDKTVQRTLKITMLDQEGYVFCFVCFYQC